MSASARSSFRLARTWGGMRTSGAAGRARRFCQWCQAKQDKAATPNAVSRQQSQNQPPGISTGALMSRISPVNALVAALWVAAGGTIRAEELVFIHSTMTAAALPHFKESAQRGGVGLVGAQLDGINSGRAEQFEELGLGLELSLREGHALPFIAGVDFDHFAGFGVLQDEPSQGGQFLLETVGDLDGDQVVPAIGLAKDGEGGLAEGFGQD